MQYILSLDQGTTSSRAMVFDHAGLPVAIAQQEFPQIFPQGGWVEHDPFDLWNSQVAVARQVVAQAGLQPTDIAAIGITSQRETVVVWDRRTGQPIHNAIVWQDRRTAAACDRLKADGLDQTIRSKTGLVLDAYFSASKLQWLLQHVDGAAARAEAGELAFGTVDSWLLWQLTEGRVHATDASNASRTMLYNIHTGRWDDELLEIFQIPRAILPEVRSSSEVYGETTLLGPPLKIAWIAGDQHAALFGQLCVRPGMVKNTYGTGCFMLMNTGETPIQSNCNLLTTIAWRIGDRTEYALEGSIFIAGAAVQWLRDGLGIIRSAADVEALAAQVADAGGVYMVPAFAGLAAPHWDSYARGTIVGLTRGSTAAHLARATLNAIALQTADVLTAMQSDAGMQLQELRVDGGATANNLLMQIQADLLGVPVLRSQTSETTALGAAYLAGLAVGYWTSTDQLLSQWQEERRFTPSIDAHRRQRLTAGWQRALERSKGWHQDGE